MSDSQVRKLMEEMSKGGGIGEASMKAGMDRKTARKYVEAGKLPSEMVVERTWRTRPDPFEEDWGEVVALLEATPELEAKTSFELLVERHPGRYDRPRCQDSPRPLGAVAQHLLAEVPVRVERVRRPAGLLEDPTSPVDPVAPVGAAEQIPCGVARAVEHFTIREHLPDEVAARIVVVRAPSARRPAPGIVVGDARDLIRAVPRVALPDHVGPAAIRSRPRDDVLCDGLSERVARPHGAHAARQATSDLLADPVSRELHLERAHRALGKAETAESAKIRPLGRHAEVQLARISSSVITTSCLEGIQPSAAVIHDGEDMR
ncbi:MAG: hypothetical protein U0414_12545 [Polyangiaceae bacterium]